MLISMCMLNLKCLDLPATKYVEVPKFNSKILLPNLAYIVPYYMMFVRGYK